MPKGDRARGKADPEDGTTPVANLLLEALAMAHLSGEEKGAVLYLWRRTYGWVNGSQRRVWDEISLTQWAAALNTNRRYALKILAGLVQKKVLLRVDLGKGKGYRYTTNTRVVQWDRRCLGEQGVSILTTVVLSKRTPQGVSKETPHLVSKQTTVVATNSRLLNKDKEILKKHIKKGKGPLQDKDLEHYGLNTKPSPKAWRPEVIEKSKYSVEDIMGLSPSMRQLILAFLEEQAPTSPKIPQLKQLMRVVK